MAEIISHWSLSAGNHPTLIGWMQAYRYEPHLHDTYTIAILRRGVASVKLRNATWPWRKGTIFCGNPYEVHAGGNSDQAIEYDVFYPSIEFMLEAGAISRGRPALPCFSTPFMLDAEQIEELSDALQVAPPEQRRSSQPGGPNRAAFEEGLLRFFRRHAGLLDDSALEIGCISPVRTACEIMRESLESKMSLGDLPQRVGCSRYYFVRLFHRVTGLAPNVYLRHLRLAKAKRLICAGYTLVEAAAEAGFADQAHLTREFKRVFGITPGRMAHDIRHVGAPVASARHGRMS